MNPSNVVKLLAAKYPIASSSSSESEREQLMASRLSTIIDDALLCDYEEDELFVVEQFREHADEEMNWEDDSNEESSNEEEEESPVKSSSSSSYVPSPKKTRSEISLEQKIAALEFYRSSASGTRTLESMTHRFRWYKPHHRDMLLKFEKKRKSNQAAFAHIDEQLFARFTEMSGVQLIIRDPDIRRWALEVNRALGEYKVANFKASRAWLDKFKERRNIVSRKVTKFVTIAQRENMPQIEETARNFVVNVCDYLTTNNLQSTAVYNCDQSGFNLETHHKRTLAIRGKAKVEAVTQSVGALTHSITIMPIYCASGELLSPLFVVIGERTGAFPQRQQIFQAPNVYVVPGKSHMMTKDHAAEWIRKVFWNAVPQEQRKLVLLVDAWSTWDSAPFECEEAAGRELIVKQLPPHTTPIIQPSDVMLFRQMKEFVRRFSDRVLLDGIDEILSSRNNLIKLMSLMMHQFQAPRFRSYLQYSWAKCGYFPHPGPGPYPQFEHPVKYCFDPTGLRCTDCLGTFFIRCARCTKKLCFHHFFVLYHLC